MVVIECIHAVYTHIHTHFTYIHCAHAPPPSGTTATAALYGLTQVVVPFMWDQVRHAGGETGTQRVE